jgi:hypothetical protein
MGHHILSLGFTECGNCTGSPVRRGGRLYVMYGETGKDTISGDFYFPAKAI